MERPLLYIINELKVWAQRHKKPVLIICDFSIVLLVFFFATLVKEEKFSFIFSSVFWFTAVFFGILTISVSGLFDIYNHILRYSSIKLYLDILGAVCLSSISGFLGLIIFEAPISLGLLAIFLTLSFTSLTSSRVMMRWILNKPKNKQNLVIFGAGEVGRQFLVAIKPFNRFKVVFFVDDAVENNSSKIDGISVYTFQDGIKLFNKHKIDVALLAGYENSDAKKLNIFRALSEFPISIRMLPPISGLLSGEFDMTKLSKVSVEEFLNRDVSQKDKALMSEDIFGKVVLVTGAGGSIGTELCKEIIQLKPKLLILLDVSEGALYVLNETLNSLLPYKTDRLKLIPLIGSVQNPKFIKKIFSKFKIDIIYHAAAYKHVPLVEMNMAESLQNNIFGTYNIAFNALLENIPKFILISSDKAVRPTNFMGASKRFAELICQALDDKSNSSKFTIVRFGNVFGSSGSVVPLFEKQIDEGGPVTVTNEKITRFFMTLSEASQLVIQAGAMSKGGEVFCLEMGSALNIKDLAFSMIKMKGKRPLIAGTKPHLENGDIEVEFVGLRPGEKLYEEPFLQSDVVQTQHKKIKKAKDEFIEFDKLQLLLDRLSKYIEANDINGVVEIFDAANIYYASTDEFTDILNLKYQIN